jgi:hypothetical protein
MFKLTANDYVYPLESVDTPKGVNAYLPIEIDTEYTHEGYDLNNPNQNICTNLTVQCRSITKTKGIIYRHPDNKYDNEARHKTLKHGFTALDYLEDNGYQVKLNRLPTWQSSTELPWLQIDVYSYFGVAELCRVFQGEFRNDIISLVVNPTTYGIEQGRRLRTFTKLGNKLFNWVELPWLLQLADEQYKVRLAMYDTCAVHGIANYASFCANSGVTLIYKDNFNSIEKSMMGKMYIERPDDFDNYALGDLYNHEALIGNKDNFYHIYESLELTKYYTPPRLTIGATVSRIVESGINKLFNAEPNNRDYINAFCKYGCADWLKRKSTTTAALNAKVDGGRCRNNRPLDTTAKGVLCDIDISGCYGEGLRVQTYPLGIPMIIDYPVNSKQNNYETLRTFLKRYDKELIPGLWQARTSCKNNAILQYKQDYLASWFPPKDISKMVTDSDFADTDNWWDVDNVGEIKVLTNEVHHAIITHDFIQWLDNVASARQRKELLDTLIIETAMFYPASERVNSIEELLRSHESHKGENSTKAARAKGKARKISIEEECHKWYGINLGELLINQLLLERKKHAKKTPFNELYKLCINTTYGDMVSPFFTVGNVVVGNNITARARALAWCMEKGFHGWQSITDGCTFDLNRVLVPRSERAITGEMSVNLYTETDCRHHTFTPLSTGDYLSVTDKVSSIDMEVVQVKTDNKTASKGRLILYSKQGKECLSVDASLNWVNINAMHHLQRLFPNLDILHQVTKTVYGNERIGQFEFEVKGFYDTATFHGTANYCLGLNGIYDPKMRSYSKKGHKTIKLTDKLEISDGSEKPSENFLLALQTPKSVGRGHVYLKERILKVGDFRRNYRKWQDTQVYPGCTVELPGLLHEFSLSQFTFITYEQLKSWRKEYTRLLRNYGQSYEMFFLNDDGSLNYQLMIETIDKAIREGKRNLFDGLDKRAANIYRQYLKHEQSECLEHVKHQLGIRYHGDFNIVNNLLESENDTQSDI